LELAISWKSYSNEITSSNMGESILIISSVALEVMKQAQAQLSLYEY